MAGGDSKEGPCIAPLHSNFQYDEQLCQGSRSAKGSLSVGAGWLQVFKLSCVGRCSQHLGPPGVIQQKVLEHLKVLKGGQGLGGQLEMGMEAKDGGETLCREIGRVCFELPVGQV